MDGLKYNMNGNHNAAKTAGGVDEEDEEIALAKAGAQDERAVLASARKLEEAIVTLLQLGTVDPAKQIIANQWLAQFVTQPFAWTAALCVAFPSAQQSEIGGSMEVRYFALNILFGKIRSDWMQLGKEDALEIFQTVRAQLLVNLSNPWFASRILVLLSAAAAVAGEETAVELVHQALNPDPIIDGSVVYDLLAAIGEEIFTHAPSQSAEVVEAIRDLSPTVLKFLDNRTEGLSDARLLEKIFVCVERWINGGFTLSELYSIYPNLLKALFTALGSSDDKCFDAAISTLSEYISTVDLLPERAAAVHVTISAVLAQRQVYAAAGLPPGGAPVQHLFLTSRSRGLVILVTVLAASEAPLLARGGSDASMILDWLVDASRGGGGLGIDGASIAAVAWPSLAAIPAEKRSDNLGPTRFAAAAKAVMHALSYPELNDDWSNTGSEEEFLRYRDGAAADALGAVLNELGTSFLSHILSELQSANTWQSAEVCLFAVASLSRKIRALAGLSGSQTKLASSEREQVAARSFLSAVFVWISASLSPSRQGDSKYLLVQTILIVVETLAEWAAIDLKSLEAGLNYTMSSLAITEVRDRACKALGGICRKAAPHLASAPVLKKVFEAYKLAMSAPGKIDATSRLAFVEGLAAVASVLPAADASQVLSSLTSATVATVKALAEMRAAANINGQVLAEELRILAVAVSHGSREGDPAEHPALPILREMWPALDVVAGHWSGDANVVTAICDLWGAIARKLGMILSTVLPSILKAATAMYMQHLVPACLDCLSDIVSLEYTKIDVGDQLDTALDATLMEVSGTIEKLNKFVDDSRSRRKSAHHTDIGRDVEEKEVQEKNAEDSLGSMSSLARALLHNKSEMLLTSKAFPEIMGSAIGAVRRNEVISALAGAKLLSETILCFSFSDDDFKGKVVWQLPSDLVPYVDSVVELHGRQVIEVVLQNLAKFQLMEDLRNALADVIYGLCLRYPGESQTYLYMILSAGDFPARKGVLSESDRKTFVSAATKHPLHPRRRFQELVNDFSKVCRGVAPAEVLTAY